MKSNSLVLKHVEFRIDSPHILYMSRVEELRQAITELSLEERAELMSALANFEDDQWDKQMKRDAATGKFDAMNRQAEADLKSGKTRPLDSFLTQSRGFRAERSKNSGNSIAGFHRT